jgi:hypothetical protein
MFNIGATIEVVNSTIKHGQIGPRRYSIGYSAAKGRIFFINFEKAGIEAATDPTSILFTKYGNDSSDRKELKGFVNIVPVLSKWTDDSEKIVRDFVNNLSISVEEEWSKIKDYMMVGKDSAIGVAVPVLGSPINLIECSDAEYVAWFNTFLRSHNIISMLNEMAMGGHGSRFSSIIDNDMLSIIRDMGNSKDRKTEAMPVILDNVTHKIAISDVLMKLVATTSSVENKKVLTTLERGLKKGAYSVDDFNRKGEFIQTLMYDFYTPVFDKKVQLIQDYAEKRLRLLAEALLRTREIMLSLSTVGQVAGPACVARAGE